jgi:hypothetical protein
VGPHVYIFDGATGSQTLDKWDPNGYYAVPTHLCKLTNPGGVYDPECNYTYVQTLLAANGFSENQVQAIFIKTSNSYPQCDLSLQHCGPGQSVPTPDAYVSERYLGNIMRYVKCCKLGTNQARYPKLQQVFITSRTYGGYALDAAHGCLMPEPFAYEEEFAVQRLIVAQIKQAAVPPVASNDPYSGQVDYNNTPWFDWGPYLWTNGEFGRNDGLSWCNGQGDPFCPARQRDVRDGDIFGDHNTYWGDYTHPSALGAEKVANKLVEFVHGSTMSPFVQDWIGK